MAELEEDIIIIEDVQTIENSVDQDKVTQEKEKNSSKIKLIIFALIGLFLSLIIGGLIISLSRSNNAQEPLNEDLSQLDEKLHKRPKRTIKISKLENIIAKANFLYTNGSKEKALSLYKNIANYSEAISKYNLGVAQLKSKQYALALKTFSQAIKNDEKRCVSAINAAVCALHIKDKKSFNYYINLAYAYLPHEINSPLYSYYYTLISYYKQDYLSALNSLKNSTSKEYPQVQKHLSAKIYALYGKDYKAIEAIENSKAPLDQFSLGLLYARVGDFNAAITHLNEAILHNVEPVKAQLALGLINIKLGEFPQAASQINNLTDMYPEEIYKHYPIRVKLKESLFNTLKAQKLYRDTIVPAKTTLYQKIFAFSPYKIFNANKTISYIRKGNANIYVNNISSATQYLQTSSSSSNVNIGITKAIQKALNLKINDANREFKALEKIQPKHSILQYNLALTYAQMGNLKEANKHFLHSYYLDAKNYLAGIYAVMTSQLIHKKYTKLHSILMDAIVNEDDSEEKELYKTLLFIANNNYISAADWLHHDHKPRPLYLLLNTLIALKLNNPQVAQKATTKLTLLLPHEILPHLLYIDAHFSTLPPKKYARSVLEYLNKQNFSFNDLYFGPYITRFLYIQENLIIGKLYYLHQQLQNMLSSTSQDTQVIVSSLALTSLYSKRFEESYTLYNMLIDDLKVQDSHTLFLGAVASTAAGHHGNAIALLELAKLKNSNSYESRFALALLYLESNNNEGATIQLSKITGDSGFQSQFFDFDIDTNKLLLKKNNP